jgi:nucleoid DNA-binding protein|tara:strand:+ start:272 stop:445 length:174 start_codon:yes stop_codon:yes gene_type:complete
MNLQEMMVSHFFSEENKKKIIEKINDNVNIPIINEKTEEKIFTAIFEIIEDVLVNKK